MARVQNVDRRAAVAALSDAIDRRDVEAAVACLSPDVVVEIPRWGGPWRGREGAAAGLTELFALCEQTRCAVRESQVGTGQVNDQVILAAKSSRAATSAWMVATATSTAEVRDGLVTHLSVDVDAAAFASQWRGAGLAAASVRSEVALIGFDPDARIVTDVRTVEPAPHRATPEQGRRRWPLWTAAAAVVLVALGVAAWAELGQRPADPAAAVSTTPPSPSPTSASPTPTPTPTPTPSAILGPSAVPVAGGGVSAQLSGTVLFDRDSSVLKPAARTLVVELARTLRNTRTGTLTVLGFTDNLGSTQQGITLSRARAEAVAAVFRTELAGTGIAITAVGRGEANPVAPNDTEANRAKNRRVEIVYRP
ncbi:MAG: OmpA family protein [Actinomycetales bacterium]|nr:OmpA family protein [Actinomycetales bacterium]